MGIKNILELLAAVAICEAAGIAGSIFTVPNIPKWYAGLAKPRFNPPSWVFGPVWTALYALMGIAAFLVWRQGSETGGATLALAIFVLQLILNLVWSYIFFGLHKPGAALVEIAALWLAILACIIFFAGVSAPAAWLLVPYIAWVSFASYLNFAIWRLNRS